MVTIHGKKQRSNHYMRKNDGTQCPRNLVFVQTVAKRIPMPGKPDVEEEELEYGVAHWVNYQGARFHHWSKIQFTQAAEFWSWLLGRLRKGISVWLVGHQISRTITHLRIWDGIDEGYWRLTPKSKDVRTKRPDQNHGLEVEGGLCVDGDPPVILILYSDRTILHVVDIENYGCATTDELAVATKNFHMSIRGDQVNEWGRREYCNQTCKSVRDYFVDLLGWWERSQLGTWRHTVGSLAMAAFRHRFMGQKILVHNCEEALDLERAANAGGEFRCFKIGAWHDENDLDSFHRHEFRRGKEMQHIGPVYHYDVNGLYPAMMATRIMPRELVAWKETKVQDDYDAWRKRLLLIACVQIETDHTPYPYYQDGERWWAVGRYTTTLCGPELDKAVENGHVIGWHRIAGYLPGKLFTEFVEYFHAQRVKLKQADDVMGERFHKLLLNALAGKWSQWAPTWNSVKGNFTGRRWGNWTSVHAQSGEVVTARVIGGHCQVKSAQGESLESCPAITAFVCAYAREHMSWLRRVLGEEHVIYQGCDSLHLDCDLSEHATLKGELHDEELGKLRRIGIYQTAQYRGPHDYTVDGRHVVAGLQLEEGEVRGNYHVVRRYEGTRATISHQPNGRQRVRTERIAFGGCHPRGIVNPDGSVSPVQVFGGVVHQNRDHADAIQWSPDGTGR